MAYYKETEFEQWLKDDSNRWNDVTSVSSYKSGVGSLIVWIDQNEQLWKVTGRTKVYDFQKYLKEINEISDRETFFSAVLNIVQKEIANNPPNKATLQNYKSYLNAFEEFFSSQPFEPQAKGLNDTHKKLLKTNSSVATYSHDELIEEFSGRITCQDRISMTKDVIFPISLIRKLWPNETVVWAKEVCENIYLIVQDDNKKIKELKIKNIAFLKISKSGEVKIYDNNNIAYVLLTSYSDPYERLIVTSKGMYYKRKRTQTNLKCSIPTKPFFVDKNQNIVDEKVPTNVYLWHVKKMVVSSIGEIAIDHDVPIALVLAQKGKSLTELKSLSDLYRKISSSLGLSVTSKKAREFNSKLSASDEANFRNIGFPSNDLLEIGKEKLVLMSSRENSIKSDS